MCLFPPAPDGTVSPSTAERDEATVALGHSRTSHYTEQSTRIEGEQGLGGPVWSVAISIF